MAILAAAALTLASVATNDATGGGFISTIRVKNVLAVAPMDAGKMMHMPLVAPLFIQNRDFTSTVVLVNDSGTSTYADLVLSRPSGQEITTYRVQFTPLSQRVVKIGDLLASAVSPETTGRVIVRQSPTLRGMPIAAQLSLTYLGSGEPRYIDEEAAMPSEAGSQILRAVADDDQGSPLVAITSLSDSVQRILVECIDEHAKHFSKSVNLLANETLLTQACSDHTIYGGDFEAVNSPPTDGLHGPLGISLASDAMPGSFAAFGLAYHRKRGDKYFSAITFSDPKMLPSGTSVFTGVPVGPSSPLSEGNYVPRLCLVNFSNKEAHVNVKYAYNSEGSANVRDLETILVSAGRSKALEFKNLRGDSGLRNSFLVNSDAAPGSLLATLSSRSDSRSGEVELLGKDEMDPTNGGNHPWSLEHGSDSTLLLFNHNTGPESFSVSISNGETTWQKIYELAPMQTEAISFRGLIQNRTKDDRGHTLPANVLSGQVTWFTRMPGVAKGRLLQSSPDTAMARSFSCAANTSLCDLTFVPNTTTFSVGSTVTFGTAQTWICDVTGEPIGTCGSDGAAQTCPAAKCNYIWSPGNGTSISGPNSIPTVSLTGAAPGTSIVNANVTDRQTGCQRAIAPIATVKPTVTFTGGNNFIFEGSDPTVTICNSEQVQGTPTQGTFSWSAATTSSNHPNISFNGSPSPYSTSSDVVTVTGDAPSSSLLDTTLTVGYSVNNQSAQTPATRTITIRLFKFLQQSGNIQVVPINGQGNPPKWGYISYVYYNIFTNPGGQQLLPGCSNISVYESVSLTNSNFPSTTVETGTGNTSQNAQVIDTLTIKADNPLPADFSASADQYLGVGGFIVRHNTLSWSQSGPSITNLGPTS